MKLAWRRPTAAPTGVTRLADPAPLRPRFRGKAARSREVPAPDPDPSRISLSDWEAGGGGLKIPRYCGVCSRYAQYLVSPYHAGPGACHAEIGGSAHFPRA